jgi:hypothetical protein
MLTHNVFFSLRDQSGTAQENLVSECKKYLADHPGIVYFFAGQRQVSCQREVNDLNFDVSLNIVFADGAAHDAYQVAPRHAQFIENNQASWKQVRVFDSFAGE